MSINNYGAVKAPGASPCEKAAQKALRETFQQLLAHNWVPAFNQARVGHRSVGVLTAMLTLGGARGTVSNAIVARGRERQDWSADYRVFSAAEWDPVDLFHGVFLAAVPEFPSEGPIVLALDDTGLPKTGQKIDGAGWIHNPLVPKWMHPAIQWGLPMFHATLIIPTREVHRPLAITVAFEPITRAKKDREDAKKRREERATAGPPTAIMIDGKRHAGTATTVTLNGKTIGGFFIDSMVIDGKTISGVLVDLKLLNKGKICHAGDDNRDPNVPRRRRGRPRKVEPTDQQVAEGATEDVVREIKDTASVIAKRTIERVRQWMDDAGMADRTLLVVADGSYTNKTVMLGLPERTEYVGRTRPDTKLHAMGQKVRKDGPEYGAILPTPERMAMDSMLPTILGDFHYAGDLRRLRYLAAGPVYRKDSTRKKPLRLLILEPVPYGQGEDRGYNRRAYLLATGFQMAPEVMIQGYLDRWQIEVLHRDLKSGIGLGQAQTRAEGSTKRIHAALAAFYALLLLANLKAQGAVRTDGYGRLPLWVSNWRAWRERKRVDEGKSAPVYRPSTTDIVTLYRRAHAPLGIQILRLVA